MMIDGMKGLRVVCYGAARLGCGAATANAPRHSKLMSARIWSASDLARPIAGATCAARRGGASRARVHSSSRPPGGSTAMSGAASTGSAASATYLNSGALWSREAMKALAARYVPTSTLPPP